jgi:hypothetical protein
MKHIFAGTKWEIDTPSPANPTSWDGGATGKANALNLRAEPATDFDPETGKDMPNPNGIRRHRRETWVDRYKRKGKLTQAQAAAADSLYAAWAGHPAKDPLAAMSAKVDKGRSDRMATMIDARRAFRLMWARVPAGAKPYLDHVVIQDLSIRSMNGCRNGQAEARYMQRLREGLDAIC